MKDLHKTNSRTITIHDFYLVKRHRAHIIRKVKRELSYLIRETVKIMNDKLPNLAACRGEGLLIKQTAERWLN